jgi:murein DD-endopeptidase MepM/ murein hydrolase activator NlpD
MRKLLNTVTFILLLLLLTTVSLSAREKSRGKTPPAEGQKSEAAQENTFGDYLPTLDMRRMHSREVTAKLMQSPGRKAIFGMDEVEQTIPDTLLLRATSLPNPYVNPDIHVVPYDTSGTPADYFYDSLWATGDSHPYGDALWAKDSVSHLLLRHERKGYHYCPPAQGAVTSGFGSRGYRMHYGIDIDLETGDPVYAAFDGVVRVAKWARGYGRVVIIRHYNGLETVYAHLSAFKITTGEKVKAGDVIGLGGNSGRSYGSHLHLEFRFKGIPVDPEKIADFRKKHDLLADTLSFLRNTMDYTVFPAGTREYDLKEVPKPEKMEYYVVKPGDSLLRIARKNGLSVSLICRLNGIGRNTTIYPGQKLRLVAL